MPKYINAGDLQAQLERKKAGAANQRYTEGWNDCMMRVKSMVSKAPAADAVPVVHGRWVDITRYNDGERVIATCSRCRDRGEVRTTRTEFGLWEIDSPCCPSCGAKMDGDVAYG